MKLNMPSMRMEPPIGILITMGQDMIEKNGGADAFTRMLQQYTTARAADLGDCWLHKCKNRPQHDIAQVYVIIDGKIYCRLYYAGYETGERKILRATGELSVIVWPRMLLSGPMDKPPYPIEKRGFQGFRYVYEPMW